MAEAFARRALADRSDTVTVSSSGLLPAGKPPADEVISLMAGRGIDVTAHRSRVFDAQVIADADLILGMERRHLTEIVAIDGEAYRRTFTLIEFVHRIEELEPDPQGVRGLDATLDLIARDRGRRDLLRVSMAQEIPDPMGRSTRFFQRVADEIEHLVDRMVAELWPSGEQSNIERV